MGARNYVRMTADVVAETAYERTGVQVTPRFAKAALDAGRIRYVRVGRTHYTTPEWIEEWLDGLPEHEPNPQPHQQVLAQ